MRSYNIQISFDVSNIDVSKAIVYIKILGIQIIRLGAGFLFLETDETHGRRILFSWRIVKKEASYYYFDIVP